MRRTRKLVSFVLVLAIVFTTMGMSALAAPIQFRDVPNNYWAKADIEKAVTAGWVNGYPDGTFKPMNNITRSEFLKMLIVGMGYAEQIEWKPSQFSDHNPSDWYTPYLLSALQKGIVKYEDYPNQKFEPTKNITRKEIAVMTVRALDMEKEVENEQNGGFLNKLKSLFSDILTAPEEFRAYIKIAADLGIVRGFVDGTFGPNREASRAEAVVMVQRTIDKHNEQQGNNSTVTPVGNIPFTDKQITYNSIDGVVDGEFRFKLWNDKTKKYETSNYRLTEEYIPDLNKRVFESAKAIIDRGGFVEIFYDRLSDGNGLVVINYYISQTAYMFGNREFSYLVYEKPYYDQYLNLTTQLEVRLLDLLGANSDEWPYSEQKLDLFKSSIMALVDDEKLFDYMFQKYLDGFEGKFPFNTSYKELINGHTIYAHRFEDSFKYYNIMFSK